MRIVSAINPRKVGLILGIIGLLLAAQSIFTEYLVETYVGGNTTSFLASLLDLFSVNLEESIPTWYATLILFIAAALLAVIAMGKRRSRDQFALYWTALAVIFVYLSMDEGAVIHEMFSVPMQMMFHTSGFLDFGWIVAAAPIVIVVGLLYVRFVFHLPARTRNLIILAGVLYIGGAMGVESVSANQYDLGGGVTLLYLAIGTVEELLEMLGVALLIYTLLAYIVQMEYTVVFQPQPALESAETESAPNRSRWMLPLGLVILFAILAGDVGLYSASVAQAAVPQATPVSSILSYQLIIDDLTTPDTVVTHTPDVFGADGTVSRQVAASMLDLFDTVMVVALPDSNESIIIAADTLPFDRNSLSDELHKNGRNEFIIFDTPVVRAMTSAAP